MNFNSLAEALSASPGSELRSRVPPPDSRPAARRNVSGAPRSSQYGGTGAAAAAAGRTKEGGQGASVSVSASTGARTRTVSHGRSQSSAGMLGRGAPPVPSASAASAAATPASAARTGLSSSQSTRRLADRPTIASTNRLPSTAAAASNTDDLRKSVRGSTYTHRSSRLNGNDRHAPLEGDEEEEGRDADTTLTGIPSNLGRFNASSAAAGAAASRTPRSSPGASIKGRPVSVPHFGTPPEMPALSGAHSGAGRR